MLFLTFWKSCLGMHLGGAGLGFYDTTDGFVSGTPNNTVRRFTLRKRLRPLLPCHAQR